MSEVSFVFLRSFRRSFAGCFSGLLISSAVFLSACLSVFALPMLVGRPFLCP